MSFAVAVYERGEPLWSVMRLEGDETFHLRIEGSPPASLNRIRDRFEAKQRAESGNDVDWLAEIPVVLAAELGGYRHDEDACRNDPVGLAGTAASGNATA